MCLRANYFARGLDITHHQICIPRILCVASSPSVPRLSSSPDQNTDSYENSTSAKTLMVQDRHSEIAVLPACTVQQGVLWSHPGMKFSWCLHPVLDDGLFRLYHGNRRLPDYQKSFQQSYTYVFWTAIVVGKCDSQHKL